VSLSPGLRTRAASRADIDGIVAAVAELLSELGSTPPAASAMEAAARELLEDREAGTLLVAEADGKIVGVLAASWQTAIHVPGRYALIQDLWVHPSWRGKAVGSGLVEALLEVMRERGMTRVEVGLPREGFPGLIATEAFYSNNGFTPLGPRMRRVPG
jgi:GNAT superfamily N-acetyltransferase